MREIAKLALYSLLTAATRHEKLHGAGRVYLIIDEFQQIVGKSMELIMRQARSKGIAMILANQTISDLQTRDGDLAPVLQANTSFKQIFSAGDLRQQADIIQASGEALYDMDLSFEPRDPLIDHTVDWPMEEVGGLRQPMNLRMASRLTRNDIIAMSSAPTQCLVQIEHGKGFSQFQGFPFLLDSSYHIRRKRFERRSRNQAGC